jgi:hypothetical protein
MRLAFILSLATVALLAPTPAAAQGQDCGKFCESCGILGQEGVAWAYYGEYTMSCRNFSTYCRDCGVERTNTGASGEALLAVLKSGSETAARSVAAANGARLLVSTARNLVVIRGTKCDPAALAAVVYVSAERARLIKNLGAQDLAIVPSTLATR